MADSRVEYLAFGVSRRFPSKVFFAGMEDLDAVRRCGFVPGGESDIARLRRPPTSYQG